MENLSAGKLGNFLSRGSQVEVLLQMETQRQPNSSSSTVPWSSLCGADLSTDHHRASPRISVLCAM